jgi:CheY-like chemotaxis protein
MSGRILIVEDEPKLASLLSDYLLQAGFSTSCLDNGLAVASWVRENDPDLVLLDLMLPGKDGLDVCKEIRSFSAVPIVMVTALDDRESRLRGLEAGAEEFVTKPADRTELRSDDEILFGARLRDQHDLWHVTSGYGRDGLGELALLAFTYAQTRNRGIGFIVLVGARVTAKNLPNVKIWRVIREAYRNGKKAAWLPAADWEAMLEKPLADVRATLGIAEPLAYREAEPIATAAEQAFKAMRAEQQKQAA